jgi:putative intracellular protease/amidase
VNPLARHTRSLRSLLPGLFLLALALRPAVAAEARYLCPPCGLPCDTTTFAALGVCPTCGMALVAAGSAAAKPAPEADRKKVAILVFTGVEIIDFSGPYEMFGAAGCDVYTVAATRDPVTSAMGLTIVPKYTFADAPRPDVLVVPGGGVKGARDSEPTLAYVREAAGQAATTMSVCNGAFILASAGLLDGLTATTTSGNIPKLASEFPKVKVVRDRRYVDNGRIITTAGLSAGIDGALHVIARLFGTGVAQQVALGEEHDWKEGDGFARAALADQQIPDINLDDTGRWSVVRTEGDRTRWSVVAQGHSDLAAADLMARIEQSLTRGHWTKQGGTSPNGAARASRWRFTGNDGKPWKATLKLESSGTSAHEFTASLSVARAG